MGKLISDFGQFDGDESFLFFVSLMISMIGIVSFGKNLRRRSWPAPRRPSLAPLYLALVSGFTIVTIVIWRWADPQVRENSGYLLLVLLMGCAWLWLGLALMPWLGLSLWEDVFEGRNLSAVWALSGAILGILLTYSGANIGEGPSFWNNVFSATLSTGSWIALWAALTTSSRAARSVTVERDLASGIRAAGFFVAEGLVLGRAVAGDWTSAGNTAHEFLLEGSPSLGVLAAAIAGEFSFRPSRAHPVPSPITNGMLPAAGYLFVAGLALAAEGGWSQ